MAFGDLQRHIAEFNEWLGEQPHLHSIRQTNACWQLQIASDPCGGRELWKSLDG
jgi:hypothetical protein